MAGHHAESLEARLKRRAVELGLTAAGIAAVHESEHRELYDWWVGREYHGEMNYLARDDARARRYDLSGTLPNVRSALVVTHAYGRPPEVDVVEAQATSGAVVVARYAQGVDYHDVVLPKLKSLHRWLEDEVGRPVAARPYVDTGPLLERELAWRAGLGWHGKNTMLIHPDRGSYFFIGVLLTELDLESDGPSTVDRCGSCEACLTDCPTGALLGRRPDGAPVMDARRCISYLTIELKGAIPQELRPAIGNRIFGCDICQEVCPWNLKFASETEEPAYASRGDLDGESMLRLASELLAMNDDEFRERYRRSPLWRTRRRGILRNLCVGLGNWGREEAVSVLVRALEDSEALVRAHAAWALGRIGSDEAREGLRARCEPEDEGTVQAEIESALGGF